jgi:hypothetical protein
MRRSDLHQEGSHGVIDLVDGTEIAFGRWSLDVRVEQSSTTGWDGWISFDDPDAMDLAFRAIQTHATFVNAQIDNDFRGTILLTSTATVDQPCPFQGAGPLQIVPRPEP